MITQPEFTPLPQPRVQFLKGDYAILVENYRLYIPSLKANVDIYKNFWYDGASKPPMLWNIPFVGTPWDADSLPSATVHDFLCETRFVPRDVADDVWYEMLVLNGVNKAKAYTFYKTVSIAGKFGAGKPSEEKVAWARRFGGVQSTDEKLDIQLSNWAIDGRPACLK